VPLQVDEERSQVYLVGSRIYYDIFVQVTEPDLMASDWGFDVELESNATGSVSCPFDYTAPNTETSYYNACSSAALTSPACGEPLLIRVRLRSHTFNDSAPDCTGVGTGPEITILPTLQCEECPPSSPSSFMGNSCNYPREASCYFGVSTPDGADFARCTCGLPDAHYQDPRGWSCEMPQ
jgi:hypothetical protein